MIITKAKKSYLPLVQILAAFFAVFFFSSTFAANPPDKKVRILFIFDASQSMLAQWQNGKKIDGAKRLLTQIIDSLSHQPNVEVALRVYGHQSPLRANFKDCNDTKLEVPFASRNHIKIKNKIAEIVPRGTTPIALTLEQSAKDFPHCTDCRNVVILITDGIEECDGDPCAVALALRSKNIILKPFIIGIGLGDDLIKQFDCVGKYVDASNEDAFFSILETVVVEAITNTTAQVSLLDTGKKPSETNVAIVLTDNSTDKIKYQYIHTLNHKGNPDTLSLDPDISYTLNIYTLPSVENNNVTLKKARHNTISANTPQGSLLFKISGFNEYKNLQAIIRLPGKTETLNVQDLSKPQKYLTGNYEVEILTLPRIILSNVEVRQSHTTTIDIPQPGIASIMLPATGFTSLYLEEKSGLKWIYNLDEGKYRQMIPLQPGNYRLVHRPLNSKESIFTKEKSFKIEPGGSVSVQLN
ncbi:MAG: VWA domain-containing protein [Bacteroidetes bacterium]|nr:VWA domain-containing protein [Bacteroidota bacterium]